MSCKLTSKAALDNTIPVTPPIVNKKRKLTTYIMGMLVIGTDPNHNVATQLKILIPVGTAIIVVAAVK